MAQVASFLDEVNRVCLRVTLDQADANIAHELFLYECAREQCKVHDPKARSYELVAQLIATDPRNW